MAWKVCEVMSKHISNRKSQLNLKRFQEVQVKSVVAQICQTHCFALYLGFRVDLMLEWDSLHGRSESNRLLRVLFGNPRGFNAHMALKIASKLNLERFKEVQVERVWNPSGFNARMGLVMCEVISKHILNRKSGSNLKRIQEEQVKRVVEQVNQTYRFVLYFGIKVDVMLEWDS
ncbi:uncharacterized protein G2W53_014486 [Senna tora]|uniref:Uncharacterized protein n=1 Tax=Senna tora TaxID=362788 RepID=A0A834WTN2_9FABA|nr:uncharacterized protein G2W53_014486 [Senna tora]